MIRFFNTLTGRIDPFKPITQGKVGLYTCGPTVYDYAHIGNFRAYLFEDLLKRFLQLSGFAITHIMNITDIDDKTIQGAADRGLSLKAYAEPFITSFFEDLERLNASPADVYPRATEHIPEMTQLIQGLLDKGFAYMKDGSVYFDISRFPAYGRLAKLDRTQLQAGRRSESDEYEKANAVDFALWKARKGEEPSWETDFGPGRPGWHIECSAMSARYLGPRFDIHCGGVDNIFPHHENEIAQSEAYYGHSFVNYWLHCHHLIVDGEKMSKSKGNFYTLRDILDRGIDPAAVRLLLLSTHYRKQLNFTWSALDQAAASVQRIRDFIHILRTETFPGGKSDAASILVGDMSDRFQKGLSDDLNISVALTSLFELIKKVNILITKEEIRRDDVKLILQAVHRVDTVIGVLPGDTEPEDLDSDIQSLIEERQKARADKNFTLSDRIRDKLLARGIVLEDTRDGIRWKKI
ncbi:MAG: cysteine--tRNA ligase [Candidatus Aminicenantes bacterium]|nr:cysteine--tRNA ligase [Candidatus Aminicenantes bacterium]